MQSSVHSLVFGILLLSEIFHLIGHLKILLRINPPPILWLKQNGYYFVFDMTSPLFVFLLTRNLIFLPSSTIHFLCHLFYIITWNTGYYSNRIADWSSLEYKGKYITIDFFLTLFDIMVHITMIYSIIDKLIH